jgi:cell volume regulation protein A
VTEPATSAVLAIQAAAGAMPAEPGATAILLVTFGALLAVSVLFSRATERVSVPVLLVFLVIGILAGSEGLGGIDFEDYAFSYRLGTIALVFILFDGGLNTPLNAVRRYIAPAAVLATIGVVGTAAMIALGARWLGFDWPLALLLGAIVSSTDAAAVFSVLRGSGLHLKRRVGVTLEVESGINDPMAVILTTVLTTNLVAPAATSTGDLVLGVIVQMVVGAAGGLAVGFGGRAILARLRLTAGGLYSAAMLALACLAFGVPTLFGGSGFLAVYLAGVVLGNGELPYRSGMLRVHDALAWLSQIAMFLILGLLVFPSRLLDVLLPGLGLALFATFVARPLVVWLCLLPFRYPWLDVTYIGYVGLRGAVPIVLATFPVLAGAPGAERIFDVVFFIVVMSAIVPGATVPWVTRRLGLESSDPPAPQAVLEIESRQPLSGRLMSFYIDDALAVTNAPISDLPFPEGSAATLIVRGDELIAPKGATHLLAGDHVYVFARPEDEPFIRLMFGRPESE